MSKFISKKFFLCLCAWAGCVMPGAAFAKDVPVEIPVQAVFIPEHGYDDNDHIVMVLSGELPHICYTLAETRVETLDHVIRVHQYAWLRKNGICGTGDADPDLTAPFETEVSLGQLEAGDYRVEFLKDAENHSVGARPFSVSVAESSDIDNYTYAAMTDVLSPKVFFEGDPVTVSIQGSTSLTCERLSDQFRVEKQNDVFVVLPIMDRDLSVPCRKARGEIRRDINLGRLSAGRYLIHMRSMNGRAVNRIIDVYPKF